MPRHRCVVNRSRVHWVTGPAPMSLYSHTAWGPDLVPLYHTAAILVQRAVLVAVHQVGRFLSTVRSAGPPPLSITPM